MLEVWPLGGKVGLSIVYREEYIGVCKLLSHQRQHQPKVCFSWYFGPGFDINMNDWLSLLATVLPLWAQGIHRTRLGRLQSILRFCVQNSKHFHTSLGSQSKRNLIYINVLAFHAEPYQSLELDNSLTGSEQFSEFKKAAAKGNLVPIYERLFSDQLTPVVAYRCLVGEDDHELPFFSLWVCGQWRSNSEPTKYNFLGRLRWLLLCIGTHVGVVYLSWEEPSERSNSSEILLCKIPHCNRGQHVNAFTCILRYYKGNNHPCFKSRKVAVDSRLCNSYFSPQWGAFAISPGWHSLLPLVDLHWKLFPGASPNDCQSPTEFATYCLLTHSLGGARFRETRTVSSWRWTPQL